jgi:hypothetical protein
VGRNNSSPQRHRGTERNEKEKKRKEAKKQRGKEAKKRI